MASNNELVNQMNLEYGHVIHALKQNSLDLNPALIMMDSATRFMEYKQNARTIKAVERMENKWQAFQDADFSTVKDDLSDIKNDISKLRENREAGDPRLEELEVQMGLLADKMAQPHEETMNLLNSGLETIQGEVSQVQDAVDAHRQEVQVELDNVREQVRSEMEANFDQIREEIRKEMRAELDEKLRKMLRDLPAQLENVSSAQPDGDLASPVNSDSPKLAQSTRRDVSGKHQSSRNKSRLGYAPTHQRQSSLLRTDPLALPAGPSSLQITSETDEIEMSDAESDPAEPGSEWIPDHAGTDIDSDNLPDFEPDDLPRQASPAAAASKPDPPLEAQPLPAQARHSSPISDSRLLAGVAPVPTPTFNTKKALKVKQTLLKFTDNFNAKPLYGKEKNRFIWKYLDSIDQSWSLFIQKELRKTFPDIVKLNPGGKASHIIQLRGLEWGQLGRWFKKNRKIFEITH